MIKKNMRRFAAGAMAAALVLATPVTAGATGAGSGSPSSGTTPQTSGTSAKVYFKENVETVVVPTKLTVAFNPNKVAMTVGGQTIDDQIVARPVAIVSQATKDKKVSVSFAVTSTNTNIKFVDSQAAANTGSGLNVCLQLVAANGTADIKAGSGASGTTIEVTNSGTGAVSYTPETLAKASMTAASGSSGTVAIKNGSAVGFKLDKATYNYASIDLDSGASSNKVTGTLAELGTTGYSAFKLTGYLNSGADWYNVGDSTTISITPTYKVEDVASGDTPITGTAGFLGAVTVGSGTSSTATAPNFTAIAKGFTYNTAGLTSITKVEMTNSNGTFDAMETNQWYTAATSTPNTTTGITTVAFSNAYVGFYSGTVAATITYVDKDGETQTTSLNIAMD